MLSALQARKLEHMFTLFDADHDGELTRADYADLTERLANVYAVQAGTAKHTEFTTGLMAQWEFVQHLADANKDQRVTLAEYQSGWDGLLSNPASFEALVGSYADTAIALADQDGDGRLTEQEFIDNLRGWGIDADDAAASFRRLDRDSDGLLTREELVQATDEFFNSDDPDVAGNWLLGSF